MLSKVSFHHNRQEGKPMKNLLITILLLAGVIILAQNTIQTYNVYDPQKSLILPEYRVKSRPDGSYAVFEKDQIVIPRWIVKDSKVYDPAKSLIIPEKSVAPWAPK